MFSMEQRRVVIEAFIRFDNSHADTVAEPGYLRRHTLRNWRKEYGQTGEIPVDKFGREPEYSGELKDMLREAKLQLRKVQLKQDDRQATFETVKMTQAQTQSA